MKCDKYILALANKSYSLVSPNIALLSSSNGLILLLNLSLIHLNLPNIPMILKFYARYVSNLQSK